MYSYITGELAEVENDCIVVDNQGIGYRFHVASSVFSALPHIGSRIKVYVYLHIREDAMIFFGFLTKEERELFQLLIGVNGIGPKAALAILGTLSVDDLRFAILADDSKAIAAAPGIGPKTAKRVILDLKDKVDFLEAFGDRLQHSQGSESVEQGAVNAVKNEVVLALGALGYSSAEVLRAMQGMDIAEDATVEALLKETLKKMALL